MKKHPVRFGNKSRSLAQRPGKNRSLVRQGFESLEQRALLAGDTALWQNPVNHLDVNGDGHVSPLDALLVVNELNLRGMRILASSAPSSGLNASSQSGGSSASGGAGALAAPASYFDVNGDNIVSALDVLMVTNVLNSNTPSARIRLRATDLDGNPITEVVAGTEFRIEALVTDLRTQSPTGVFGAYFDLTYDPTKITLEPNNPIEYGPDYLNGKQRNFSTPGLIDETGSFATNPTPTTPLGPAERVLYSVTIHVNANATGTLDFGADTADLVGSDGKNGNVTLFDENVGLEPGLNQILFQGTAVDILPASGLPLVTITDVEKTELNSGSQDYVFTVNLSAASGQEITVKYETQNDTAVASGSANSGGADFVATSGTLTFAAGETSKTITVVVNGDTTTNEGNETFNVSLLGAVNADIADSRGLGTITNDDATPTITISDPLAFEGTTGNTLQFVVTLSAPSQQGVVVHYSTADGTATAGSDYQSIGDTTLSFSPGSTSLPINVAIIGDTSPESNETVLVNLSQPAGATLAKTTATGTIVNDDGAQLPTLSIGDFSATEGGSGTMKPFVFPVTLSAPTTAPVIVVVDTSNGTATTPSDYQPLAAETLTIPAGATTANITVMVVGNSVQEPDETFNVTLSNPIGATILDGLAVGTIINDDGVVLPTLSIGDVTQAEGNSGTTNFIFPITISAAAGAGTVTVVVNTAGITATSPADFAAITNQTVTFTGATLTQNVTVQVVADAVQEPDETFNVNLSNAVGASLADPTGVGTITNDDAQQTISIADVTLAEGTGGITPFVFTLTLSATSASNVTVQASTSGGTATAGADYTALTGQLVTFLPGQTSTTLTVNVVGDALDEINETFNVTLANAVGAAIGDATALATITDDDNPPSVSIGDTAQVEGNTGTTNFVFAVTLSAASGQQVLVPFSTSNGSATTPADYTQQSGTLTFAAGQVTQNVTVVVQGDTAEEQNETFNVTLGTPTNATLGVSTAVGTILDDDGPPSLSINNVTQAEGNTGTSNFVFTVTMAGSATVPVTVVVGSSVGSASAGTDYTTLAPQTLTFNPGVSTQQVTVSVNGDAFFESNETFLVVLSNASGGGATIGTANGVGTITNDDAEPVLTINDVTQVEGNAGVTSFVFTVTRTGSSEQTITVTAATSNGTATTADNDYTVLNPQTVVFPPGGPATQEVTIFVNGDSVFESDETFNVNLTSPNNAVLGKATGVGTITNDDGPPTLSIADVTSAEGNTGTTNFVFTVTLSGNASQTVTVVAATAIGAGANPASTPGDYAALPPQTLTFAVGETSKTVTVQVVGDTVSEADETFNVVLSNATVATIADGTAIGTISNDDGAPSLSITDVTQNEGNSGTSNFVFNVSLSSPSGQAITVVASSANGTATAGQDYTALVPQTLTFAPGETSKSVTVVVQGDVATESNETFNVNLTNASAGATVAKSTGLGTITNDDGVPSVSIGDVTQNEGNSGTTNFVFTVTLSGGSSNPVTVNFATSALTAAAGSDFITTSGVLTFAANETSKTITVEVIGDTLHEASETFNVNLTAPTNAALGDGVALGTITNDDAAPGLSIADVILAEGNAGTTNFVFNVTLGAASGQQVTVNFATADGNSATTGANAIAGGLNSGDYTATSGTLTFAPGELSKSITVAVRGDTFDEPNQSFTVNLTAPINAILTDGVATGTITNDDVGGGTEPANVSGFVYVDINNGGTKEPSEKVIAGAIIRLTGMNEANEPVFMETTTNALGAYSFTDIEPGQYTITETQPASYLDGIDRPGSATVTSTASDTFTFSVSGGENLQNNNFGERGLRPELISKRGYLASSANVTNGSVQALNVSAGDAWLPYDAGWDGTLTAEASASGAGGNPTLALYDNSFNLLASGSGGADSRLDWDGTPGAPYFLRVGGGNTAVDLTVTNLVSEENGVITVQGTAGDDEFEFSGATGSFSINGVRYDLNPAHVSRVVFNGGGGNDSATLSGSAAADVATLGLGFGGLASASYNVSVGNVESLAVNGGGGYDQATLQDSALADHLSAEGDWLTVSSADDLSTSISGFDSVRATSSHGGDDTTDIKALDFVLERLGQWS